MIKKMFALLAAVLFVVPFVVAADDFDDDFDGMDEESEESEESEEDEEEAPAKKVKEESESDAAMRDLMGEPEEEKPAAKAKKQAGSQKNFENQPEDEGTASDGIRGLKPVMLVKGSFNVYGSYKKDDGTTNNTMFGAVDEGILGLEYAGEHVIAKGTLNLRTNNQYINKMHNPLMKENLHSVQNGFANALYEIYGGVKFFDVFIKAGKMLPEYGLVDSYQELGMGFATPFLTRSLITVEGYIPETDAGFALGYNGTFAEDHNIFVGLSLGTGSNSSEFWYSDRTMGLYGRIGYAFRDYMKAAIGVQYRKDYYSKDAVSKKLDALSVGVHLKGGYAGFEIPITYDFVSRDMYSATAKKNKANKAGHLISVAPGYAYSFDHEWIDKVAVAVRFDFVRGVYIKNQIEVGEEGNKTYNDKNQDSDRDAYVEYDDKNEYPEYLNAAYFKKTGSYMRLGVTANFFTKELAGVRAMAGFTFIDQFKSEIYKKNGTKVYDYGFMAFVLQAGAEF